MNPEEKLSYFEYTLSKLLAWYTDITGSSNNDLSTLKALKLLFFVSAAKATMRDSHSLVDDVFDKFVAMPYGPVESDIYSRINLQNGNLTFFSINNSSVQAKESFMEGVFSNLDPDFTKKIDESIDLVRSMNENLINLSAFDLVELSHLWYSWRKNYQMALDAGQRSKVIPVEDIKAEIKIYKF